MGGDHHAVEDLTIAPPTSLVVESSLAVELFGAALVLRTGRKAPPHPLFDPENLRIRS